MKEIPDFDIERSQSVDYIMGSGLAKKAFEEPPFKNYANILKELIESIDRLADNCHMPEFTNHAMPHVCGMVKRASEWGENDGWLGTASPLEAACLLMALVIHDIGMLSRDSRDIPDSEREKYLKGLSSSLDTNPGSQGHFSWDSAMPMITFKYVSSFWSSFI